MFFAVKRVNQVNDFFGIFIRVNIRKLLFAICKTGTK